VGKWWSVLFAVVMLACFGLFVAAPFAGWWMPEGVSAHAWDIDRLFYIILAITGFFFVLTEALLVVFMYRYASKPAARPVPVSDEEKHKEHDFERKLEIGWTIVPAAILLYIAFAQVGAWADAKYKSRMPAAQDAEGQVPVHAEVSARQFEWRIRYPSTKTWAQWKDNPDAAKAWFKAPQADDVRVVNQLHVIKNRPVLLQVGTLDVLHSFNVPHMRVKQDTLPGKKLPVWFTPIKSNTVLGRDRNGKDRWEDGGGWDAAGKPKDASLVWEIACAELCGWGHYRMIGRVYVHETAADFEAWLAHAEKVQNVYELPKAASR
jgi:cytochrome c oxidase subunit 2